METLADAARCIVREHLVHDVSYHLLEFTHKLLGIVAVASISRSCIIASNGIKSIVKQSGRLRIIPFVESPIELTVSRSRVDDFMAWLER